MSSLGLATRGYMADLLSGDAEPPTITVVYPLPGADRGSVDGFPIDDAAAAATPIVIDVADDAAIAFVSIVAQFGGARPRESVFRRGAFQPGYSQGSWTEQPDTPTPTLRLHVRRDSGWPLTEIEFDADAVDGGGNLD